MKPNTLLPTLLGTSTLVALWMTVHPQSRAVASSHREAPFITELPKVDGTDFYMFRSYEPGRENFVTLIANYQPLQDPYGGPNYFSMDPEAYYEIHIDNDGDNVEDLSFRFDFTNRLRDLQLPVGPAGQEVDISVPLKFIGPVTQAGDRDLNELESYRLSLVQNGGAQVDVIRDAATGSSRFAKPLDNVGTKTLANYGTYAAAFVRSIQLPDGSLGRVFVGQRRESFFVDLGGVFDLVNLDPVGSPNAKPNSLADKNITTLALEIPISSLTNGIDVLGAWTTASLPRRRVIQNDPTYADPAQFLGPFVQVSRLGMPLVNEVVIGLPDKNRFNAGQPLGDAQFADYVTHPTLPAILEALFGVQQPTQFPRTDLVEVFLTGIPGLNNNGGGGEMLRLNTTTPVTPRAGQSNLGVLGGDNAGFPNGRRPGDDVVDVSLRVAMGVLLPPAAAPSGQLPYTDGVTGDAMLFDDSFPYLTTPIPGAQ